MSEPVFLWPCGPVAPSTGARPSMRQIAEAKALERGLTVAELKTPTRSRAISWPRQEAIAAMHEAGFSHNQIKHFFGLKDHTTCMHACREVKARAAGKPQRAPMPRGPRVDNAGRNARIIALFAQDLSYREIGSRLGLSVGVVAGVVCRYGDALKGGRSVKGFWSEAMQ